MVAPRRVALLLAMAQVLLGPGGAAGEPCPEPQVVPSYYTTSDAVIAAESVFIVEISLACKNGAQNVALYADVNGKQFPVTRGQDIGRYQAQRNNEDVSKIQPLFTVNVEHRGAWTGPWVSSEVLAAAVGLVAGYLALSARSRLQA
ncbi:translocon-associated protein subunit delta isoform X2 [Alligator sinensis]|uniref:Translocon-associated protein subunit delta n=1 Tax=Alligator sinensis TaxID=38654 RepID=A0A1U8DQ24_ALLSI|nr:translocon-associated protein subunit delta isoform X2 [Alligator sinensis]